MKSHFLTIGILVAVSGISQSASPVGDVVGKITVGYQGWFAAPNSGQPGSLNGWWHWARNMWEPVSSTNVAVISWPDMTDYTTKFKTNFANLGNSDRPATLFSSYSDQTVDIHFQWMRKYGIDTAALQRFNPNTAEGPARNGITIKVRKFAEKSNVKFYIMYDMSGWSNMRTEMKADWIANMTTYTKSRAYARQNGKPVVGIWGFGFTDRPGSVEECLDLINWFKSRACYVMGGVPTGWRSESGDSKPGFLKVYDAFDMISPWMVGRIGNVKDADNAAKNYNKPDQDYCNSRKPPCDYQPCVIPGDLSVHQRAHGDFMWRQFYNLVSIGVQGIYVSMFDEYNEGNQIAKTAMNSDYTPKCSGFVTLDEDGVACSSDYYMRLTGDGGKMLKKQLKLTSQRPTLPMPRKQKYVKPSPQKC